MCRMSMTIQCRVYSNLHEVFWCTLVQKGATIDARENPRVHTLIILICANLPTHGRPRSISASLTTPYARLPGSGCSCVCFADCVFVCICGCCTNSMNCANACQCTAYIFQGCCWGITLPHKSVGSYCKLPEALQACLCALFFITCHARWINYDEQDWIRPPWVQHPLTSTLPMN